MGCASNVAVQNSAHYRNMTCEELTAALDKMKQQVATKQQHKEMNRTVDTGTTVAAQGASLAGVPYVGGVVSIAKTLFNHNKQTTENRASTAENAYYTVENIAYEKGCL